MTELPSAADVAATTFLRYKLRPHYRVASRTSSVCSSSGASTPTSAGSESDESPIACPVHHDVLHRLLQAELAVLERDQKIEALEARVRQLESKDCVKEVVYDAGRSFATDADLDGLCVKSEALLHQMSSCLEVGAGRS